MTDKELEDLKMVDIPLRDRVQAIFTGTCALRALMNEAVIPLIKAMINRNDQEEAIACTYYRMSAWMGSLVELKRPIHLQSVCAAARSMFELLIDVKQLVTNPGAAEAFHAFTFVRRFCNAKLTVEYHDNIHGVDPTVFVHERAFVTDAGNISKCDALRTKHWGTDGKGKLIWPDHWNNRNAFARAHQVGAEYEETYRVAYGRLCWYLHAGGVGFGGLSRDGIESGFGWAHTLCQRFSYEASEEVSAAFHLFEGDGKLREKLEYARSIPARSLVEVLQAAKEAKD